MKRVIAALAALLVAASVADARVLVTSQRMYGPGTTGAKFAGYRATEDKQMVMVQSLLRRFGVDYAVVPPEAMRTEFARTGVMVWNYGTAGAFSESFDAVIIVNALGKLGDTTPLFNPESLTFSSTVSGTGASHGRGVPTVPVLEILAHAPDAGAGIYAQGLRDSSGKDSTGVRNSGSTDYYRPWTLCQLIPSVRQEGTTTPWWATGYNSGIIPNSTPPAGGFRAHLRTSGNTASSLYFYESDGTLGSNVAAWLDSMEFTPASNGAGADTLVVWERPMSHITGAKPIVWVYPYGQSACAGDSAQGSNRWPCEYDVPAVTFALARIDSLTGGRVIKKQIMASPVLTGAFSRQGPNYRGAGGMNPADTSAVWAVIDSLTANCPGIPWTIGGNPDSVTAYASEVARWKRLRTVRWNPWNLRGISDTTKAGGYGADPWGRYRARPVAVGPYNLSGVTPQDSSLYSVLRFNRDSLARAVNGDRSGCAIAPFDDWTPKNTRPFSNGAGSLPVDSVLYAATRAGFTTVVYNAQRPFTFNTMMGYKTTHQGLYGSRLGSGVPFTVKMLGHSGMSIAGSAIQQDMRADSVLAPGVSNNCNALTLSTSSAYAYNQVMLPAYEQHRWWYGLTMDRYRDYDFMIPFWFDAWDGVNKPLDDVLYDLRSANVIRLNVSDFGSGGSARPTRPGYWAIKSLYNSFAAINRAAGRPVAVFAYPEDVQP